jgi:PmbA protein
MKILILKKLDKKQPRKAVRMLGAKEYRYTKSNAVVLDPYVATNFLGVLAPALIS